VYAFTVFTLGVVIFFTEAVKREARAVLQGAPEIVRSSGSWPGGTTSSRQSTSTR